MKKPQCKRFAFYLFTLNFLTAVLFHGGCGLIAHMGTPTGHEKKVPAEYDLSEHKDQKILILVNQPAWLGTAPNLRYYLTDAINGNLMEKVKLEPEHFVSYSELSEFRSNRSDFSLLSPVEVGRALGADMVLFVMIEDYQLHEIAESGYYKGFLSAQSALLEMVNGEKLWPEFTKSKSIKVGFEVESHGREIAAARLTVALAHCTTRYFYDCPRKKFKISDDRSGIGWKSW